MHLKKFLVNWGKTDSDLDAISRRDFDSSFVVFYPYAKVYGGIERNILALAEFIYIEMGRNLCLITFECDVFELLDAPSIRHIQLDKSSSYLARIMLLSLKISRLSLKTPILTFGQKGSFFLFLAGCTNYLLHYTDPPSLLSSSHDNRSHFR